MKIFNNVRILNVVLKMFKVVNIDDSLYRFMQHSSEVQHLLLFMLKNPEHNSSISFKSSFVGILFLL